VLNYVRSIDKLNKWIM